jgi:mannosyltransferase
LKQSRRQKIDRRWAIGFGAYLWGRFTDDFLNRVGGRRSAVSHLLILFIILLGTFLRVTNLTYHSFWFDEAVSVRWARSSLPRIIEVGMNLVEDRLPPLYYLLLKGWSHWAGWSEFSLRYLSVMFGVLLIPIVYVLGRRLFSRSVGLLAALLVVLNPFLIWYSQEARMYALAVLLGSFGVLCFVLAITSPTPPLPRSPAPLLLWLGLGLSALAGLYTHLYTGFLWPALVIWLLLNPKYLKRVWFPFGLTMVVVTLLFLPLAQAIWHFSGESQPGDPLAGSGGRLFDLFRAFVIWQAPLSPMLAGWVIFILGIFLLSGVVLVLKNRNQWLVLLLLLMPFLIASLLLLRSNLAFFGHRYFIVMVPWLMLLQALGVIVLCRASSFIFGRYMRNGRYFLAWGGVILMVAVALIPVPGQWSTSAAKEAWRQTLVYMTRHVRPGDAVFIHPEWVRFPYQYYAAQMHTPGRTYAAFFSVEPDTDIDGPLNGILKDHPVIWLIQSHLDQPDPDHRVEGWFAARYPLVTELYPPGITLKAYAPGYRRESLPVEATPVDITFAEGLHLVGFDLWDTHLTPRDNLFHPPSNWLHVTFYWSAPAGAPDVLPYAHLVDDLGQVWGASLERNGDALRLCPPSRWRPEQIIRQDLDVNLNPAAPPGQYRLVVGLGQEKQFVAPVWLEAESFEFSVNQFSVK